MLYIVSTPIGNLEDITIRAINTLKEVDYIAAEDTRHAKRLLDRYEINTPLLSYHSHSSKSKEQKIIDIMKDGKSIALISDAGTPGISDPAYSLVNLAIEHDIELSPIPGPSALLAGLVVSGLPTNKFQYLGFIPAKKGRQTFFKSLVEIPFTTVFFESPHRLCKTLSQLNEFLEPERKIAIGRELTKIYEEIFRGNIAQAKDYFDAQKPKGEFVIILNKKGS